MNDPSQSSDPAPEPTGRRPRLWRTVGKRLAVLGVLGALLYLLGPQVLAVFASAPRLGEFDWWWFPVMFASMSVSFAGAWALAKIAVPGLPWIAAATSQLASNAASRVFPGGPVVGGALYFRMLSESGVRPGDAAAALAANSLISYLVLFILPAVAAVFGAIAAPVPAGLLPVATAGLVVAVLLLTAGAVAVRFDAPLRLAARVTDRMLQAVARLLRKNWRLDYRAVLKNRDSVVSAMGPHWVKALGAATANWIFDYLTLVAALFAVGARPRLSLVLLAFASAAVLGMLPITPGGLGFVEAGLAALLTLAGVPAGDALVATLAYRLFQFWLPIPLGGLAFLLHRRRYVTVGRAEAPA